MTEAVAMRGITKSFGAAPVLRGIALDFRYGEVHCLLGENGAGKSTAMKILAGVYGLDSGTIELDGKPLLFSGAQQAIEAGISMVHQELTRILDMSVAENIFLGRERTRGLFTADRSMRDAAAQLCAGVGLDIDVTQSMRMLSTAEAQLVEIVKAVHRNAKVLIFDEPTSSLSVKEVEHLFLLIDKLREQGTCIIYISHKLDEIFRLGDRVTTLRDGEVTIADKSVRDVTEADLIMGMVGRQLDQLYPRKLQDIPREAQPVLEVSGLSKKRMFTDISFSAYRGEILGVAGLVGAGRSETMNAIFGAIHPDGGFIRVDGQNVHISSPRHAVDLGIGLVPEDRKELGLIPVLSVRENMTVTSLTDFTRFSFINNRAEEAAVNDMAAKLQVRTDSINKPVSALSGGNQQKVVLSKWLLRDLKVLILDEPTRGVDVGAKFEIYTMMRKIAADGVAIVMVSSELPELLGMCDRMIVFRRGRIAGELTTEGAQEKDILQLAL